MTGKKYKIGDWVHITRASGYVFHEKIIEIRADFSIDEKPNNEIIFGTATKDSTMIAHVIDADIM